MKEKISEIIRNEGLSEFGFCSFSDAGEILNTRNATKIPQNAKSIITILFPYKVPVDERRNLSLYCIGKDYHDIVLSFLNRICDKLKEEFNEEEFVSFCDNSPIREVNAAYMSGLGFLGKNSLLINRKFGSYCFIGEIVTTLEFNSYSAPLGSCINCGACLNNCVGGALKNTGGDVYILDKESCLSAITQKKGDLSEKQVSLIKKGALVWGCDKCSTVCPMNMGAEDSNINEFYLSPLPYLTRENISECKDRAYGYKGEKILLRNIGIIYGEDGNNN